MPVREEAGTRALHLAPSRQWNGFADAGAAVDRSASVTLAPIRVSPITLNENRGHRRSMVARIVLFGVCSPFLRGFALELLEHSAGIGRQNACRTV